MKLRCWLWLALGPVAWLQTAGGASPCALASSNDEFLRGPVPSASGSGLPVRQASGVGEFVTSGAWPVYTGQLGMWSPVIGNFDPDYPGEECIVTIGTVRVFPSDEWTLIYVIHADGSLMDGWAPLRIDLGAPDDGPALADLDGDGNPELVLALDEDPPIDRSYVTVLDSGGHTVPGRWPVFMDDVATSTPVLSDLDGDGLLEVLVASREGMLHIWRHDGTVFCPEAWPKPLEGLTYDPPAVGRGTRHSLPMIVVGCQLPANAGSLLYAFHPDGTLLDGAWPLRFDDWRVFTPTIADIDQDGRAEIVIGGGSYLRVPGHVYAYELDGTPVAGEWPQEIWDPSGTWPPGGYPYFISIADLDPDYPGLEIVTAPNYRTQVYAFHADGSAVPGWPHARADSRFVGNPPVIGDFDDSPGLEVVVGEGAQDPFGRHLYMIDACGWNLPGTPLDLGGFMQAGGVLADVDHDGRLEYIQPVAGTGMIERIQLPGPGVHSGSVVWAMQQNDACRTSFFPDFPEPIGVPDPSLRLEAGGLDGNPLGLQVSPGVAGGRSTLHLALRQPGRLTASLYDVRGRRVGHLVDAEFAVPGERVIPLSLDPGIASGIYFVRASAHSPAGSAVRCARIVIAR